MLWTIIKAFGWKFGLENWGIGIFWRWYHRDQKEIYLSKCRQDIRDMVQRWYLFEKEDPRDHELVVVAVLSSWVILRAYEEDQMALVSLMKEELSKRVMWLEGGL